MPKKKRVELKNTFNKRVKEFLTFLPRIAEEGVEEVVHKVSDALAIQRMLKRYLVFLVSATAALTITLYGAGQLLGAYFPTWPQGISHIIVGVAALLAAWYYKSLR